MSKKYDIRFSLVYWGKFHGHTVEECIDLVDTAEGWTASMQAADSGDEVSYYQEAFDSMKASVIGIYEFLNPKVSHE